MTPTIEGNKLIAEFMELYLIKGEKYPFGHPITKVNFKEARYHYSWDWLMPVWKKCIEVIGLWAHTHKEDRPSAIWIEASGKISRAMQSVDIDKAFTEITHLITWYNQQNQK